MDIEALSSKLDEVLHRYATREEDGGYSSSNALLSEIASLSHTLNVAMGQNADASLPVKTLEELRVLGSTCWNMTLRHTARQDGLEEQKLKSSMRNFATRVFLLGNYAYSSSDICHSYFTQHLREAEQCVLMCLKTSRDLSLCGMAESAIDLLATGENIASHIHADIWRNLSQLRYRNMGWEFAYTKMEVSWNAENYQASSQAAERLAQMLTKDNSLKRDYREAYFRFIFTVGNATVPTNEEACIRSMLMRSIEVQNHFKEAQMNDPPHHLTILHGTSMEQVALSWLREKEAVKALPWAEEADVILHSSRSVLLRLIATAEAGIEPKAIMLLHEYVQRIDVIVDEAVVSCFELHKLLKDKEGCIEGMRLLCQRVKGTTSSESVVFRFVQLLLQNAALSSCRMALKILQEECVDFEDPKHRRYCFIWLWELSDTSGFTHSQMAESLEAALRYKDCASDAEIGSLQLRLCAEYISGYESKEKPDGLTNAEGILLKYIGRKPRCPFARCLLLKICVLKSDEAELENELQCLMKCEPIDLVVPALCTTVNYCLTYGFLPGASLSAARAIFSLIPFPDIATEVEMLRVYVALILSKSCTCSDEHLQILVERFRRLLLNDCDAVSLSHDEVKWWAQAFLLFGSDFTEGPGPASVLSFRTVVLVATQDPSPGEDPSYSLLLTGLLCTLEDEFQLFSSGRPQIDSNDLGEQLRLCREVLSTTSGVECRLTVLLAEAECHLRCLTTTLLMEKMDTLLEEMSSLSAAFEDYEALADGASFVASQCTTEDHTLLHSIVMKLYMRAASAAMTIITDAFSSCVDIKTVEDDRNINFITDGMSCLYKSFTFALDRSEQLVVVQQLGALLSMCNGDVTLSSFIRRYHAEGVRPVAGHSMSFVFLFAEYFTVEAWNNSVFYLHLSDIAKQTEWARIAWELVDILPPSSSVASTLLALKAATCS